LFFAFTSSPQGCKKLCINDLQVKDSPLFPSPVKAKRAHPFTRKTHGINKLRVKVKGEGKNCELAECAMRRGVSVRAYGGAEEETANGRSEKERASFPKKMERKKRKEGEFRKKVHKFSFDLSLSSKNEIFFSRKIRLFEIKILLLRLIKPTFPFTPPHCGVHIAQSRGTFPDPPAQTLFDLLNHRDFALSLPIGTWPQRRSPSQSGDICPTATRPLGFVPKEGGAKDCFSSTKRGTHLLWTTRFGQPHSFLVLPPGGESDHHYLIFGGLAF